MDASAEFNSLYLPELFRYVVPVFQQPDEVGSGVLVKIQRRHFVATAAHCIKNQPQVGACSGRANQTTPPEPRLLRILNMGCHTDEDMDIGYLEIEDPKCAELEWEQLCLDPVPGAIHIVGHPVADAEIDLKRKELTLGRGAFQTSLNLNQASSGVTFTKIPARN